MTTFDNILYEVEKGRARITLNRPSKLNALSLQLQAELNEALWEADNDNDVHCVHPAGCGPRFLGGLRSLGSGSPRGGVARAESGRQLPSREQHRR